MKYITSERFCKSRIRMANDCAHEYNIDALRLARLGWQVVQQPIYTDRMEPIPGYKANVRDSDCKVLGVVTDRYKIIQYHYP